MDESYRIYFESFLEKENDPVGKKAIISVNTPIYSLITKLEYVHIPVILEAKFVHYLDLFYERGDEEFFLKANIAHTELYHLLNIDEKNKLSSLEKKLGNFFEYEKQLSKKVDAREIALYDLENYTILRSSDVFLYSMIAGFFGDFPEEYQSVLHYIQMKEDLKDDLKDIELDSSQGISNSLMMRAKINGYSLDEAGFKKAYIDQKMFIESIKPKVKEFGWIFNCIPNGAYNYDKRYE